MAISEDTAAIVAAQLTVAWATKTGIASVDAKRTAQGDLFKIYTAFLGSLREVPIKHLGPAEN